MTVVKSFMIDTYISDEICDLVLSEPTKDF